MKPALVHTIAQLRSRVSEARKAVKRIGLVPTMGALHEGHASLVRAARRDTDFVVLSLFVNPTQFGPNEDLARYPRTLASDEELCEREGVAAIFAPAVAEMYPEGFRTFVDVTGLQDVLCGVSRPGHFRGVATVVLKLLNIVQPDVAYFGQKDAQQARIIEQMVADLDVPVRIEVCPIVREPDGLALSSRNRYLQPEERQRAIVLWQVLSETQERIRRGERDAKRLRADMCQRLRSVAGAEVDYAEIVDAGTLLSVDTIVGDVLVAVAVRLGKTRLIDNVKVEVQRT